MPSPQPEECIEVIDVLGTDLTVVNSARVSMAKSHAAFDEESDTKLIRYLARNSHWTPFAQPQVQLRITVPIFVARQWTRSEIGTDRCETPGLPPNDLSVFNEVSRRYVDDTPVFFRFNQFRYRPSMSVKQGSGGDVDRETNEELIRMMLHVENVSATCYNEMIAMGVAPEQARAMLPNTLLTQWIETGSLAYWARFVGLRLDGHAQKEIRDYAVVLDGIMLELFPVSWAALRGKGE